MKRLLFSCRPAKTYFLCYDGSVKGGRQLNFMAGLAIIFLLAVGIVIYVMTQLAQAAPSPWFTEIGVHPQAAAQPTADGKMLRSLTAHNGKLYAAYGDWTVNTGPIHINPFNLTTDTFEGSVLSVPTEAIQTFRNINGRLVAPMTDPTGSYTVNQGYAEELPDGSWQNSFHMPMEHVFDVATLDGNDLWMVGHRRASDGTELDAVAYRSTDNGATWTAVQTDASPNPSQRAFDRYYWLLVLNDKMYMQADTTSYPPLRSFDGTTWETGTTAPVCEVSSPSLVEAFAGHIVCAKGEWNHIGLYDGTTLSNIFVPVGVATDFYIDGGYLYVIGSAGVYRTSNLENWQRIGSSPAGAYSIAVADDYLYIGTKTSQLFRSDTTITAMLDNPAEPEEPVLTLAAEACFNFNSATGTIVNYYAYEGNNIANPSCPRAVEIPSTINGVNVTAIGDDAFYNQNLMAVTIPDFVTTIGNRAFGSNNLLSIELPDSLTSIGNNAFQYNQLASLTWGSNLITIGSGAFMNNQLISISVPDTVTTINSFAFRYNSITSVDIPESVTSFGSSVFGGNLITSLTIGMPVIPASEFGNNPSLVTLTLEDTVKSIGYAAFSNASLTSLTIPSSVTEIKSEAFSGGTLSSLTIHGNPVVGYGAFSDNSLRSITITDNPTLTYGLSYTFPFNGLDSTTVPNELSPWSYEHSAYYANNAELVRIYATNPDFIASHDDTVGYVCDGPCYFAGGYIINPASVNLSYVNSVSTALLAPNTLVSSTPSLVPDYRLIHILDNSNPDSPTLDFSAGNYYRTNSIVTLTAEDVPNIEGYVTPAFGAPFVLTTASLDRTLVYYTHAEWSAMNGGGTLAETGSSALVMAVGGFGLVGAGSFLWRRQFR